MKRSPLLKKYVLYFMICALIPVLILALIYYVNAQRLVIRELERTHAFALRRSADSVDRRLNEFRTIAQQISEDADLTPYMVQASEYNRMIAVRKLPTYYARTDFLENMLLYYHGDEIIYSGNGICSFPTLLNKRYNLSGDWDEADFRELLISDKPFTISPSDCFIRSISANGDGMLVLTYPCPPTYPLKYGTIAGIVNSNFFADALGDSDSELSSLAMILDEEGRLLFSAGQHGMSMEGQDTMAIAALAVPGDMTTVRSNARRYTVIHEPSRVNGWIYISILPHDQFGNNFIAAQTPVLLALLTLLLTGIFLSVFLGYRNYRPIQELWRVFHTQTGPQPTENELQRIGREVRWLLESHEDIRLQLGESLTILVQRELQGVLLGERMPLHPETDKRLQGPLYYVVVVGFAEPVPPEDREMILASLNQTGEQMSSFLELSYKDYIAVIRNVPQEHEGQRAYGNKLCRLIESVCERKSRIGIGGLYEDIWSLHTSCTEALAAMESIRAGEEGAIVLFDEIESGRIDSSFSWYQPKIRMRLTQALLQASKTGVEESIRQLREFFELNRKSYDPAQMSFVMFDIIMGLLPLAEQADLPGWRETADALVHYQTLPDFLEMLGVFCNEILVDHIKTKEHARTSMRAQAVAFIEEHCFRQDFSLSMLANHLNVTVPYASRFIRDTLNVNFMDYLTDKRMTEACRLLSETDWKIRQIVEAVGYLDAASFTRKFTQQIGMSPSRYRETR